MRIRLFFSIVLLACALAPWRAQAQQPVFSRQHGFCEEPFLLTISSPAGQDIRYTLDASEPTAASTLYTGPLSVRSTTVVRAAAFEGDACVSPVTTATYLFVNDILKQSNTPAGYPAKWGRYTTISGTAQADYEMDPEMTDDPTLRPKIAEGLQSLPVVSIVTDRDNLFSHENDSVRGGIYIFTGPPVGDNTGHGWTRPASVEMFEGTEASAIDFSTTCGLRLHGGHGRLAEKNPKHSFRLVFKEQYGAKSLKFPLFSDNESDKFDQLVLRCHFGNAWQHWDEGNRKKAQYTRDVWARRMQRRMGRTSVNALYVNVFINGMYWGLYNLAERVDDQFGKDHLGGKKSDIDVIKIEEDGGNHIEATEGTLDAWNQMTRLASIVGGANSDITPEEAYQELCDSLLDIDDFIDYMLINQYGGNTDWDHHNWYALRRRGTDSQGFRFLCWDSEIIQENVNENVLSKNNGSSFPTGIFQNLLRHDDFARRYVRRAKVVFAEDGPLGQTSVVEVWDSLYQVISKAIYAEAARWGDYRRDVHRWQSAGQFYTVDNHYMTERQRLLNQYFPFRSDKVLSQILAYVNVDDFEAPDNWERLTAQMFHQWNGNAIDSQPLDKQVTVDWNFGYNAGGGTAIAGFGNVEWNKYADLSAYESLVLRGSGSGLRILANRLTDHGPYKQIVVSFNEWDNYWDASLGAIVLPLEDLCNATTNEGKTRVDDFVHLHVLKVNWSESVCLTAAYLVPKAVPATVACDVNDDGTVDVADIAAIISYMSGASVLTLEAVDTNGDGHADVADIATVISTMAAASRGEGRR